MVTDEDRRRAHEWAERQAAKTAPLTPEQIAELRAIFLAGDADENTDLANPAGGE